MCGENTAYKLDRDELSTQFLQCFFFKVYLKKLEDYKIWCQVMKEFFDFDDFWNFIYHKI